MNIFFTSDLHLGHGPNKLGWGGIIMHAKRPFANVEEMNEALISNYNSMVGQGDHCWILGDFAWRDHRKFLHRLNGKKFLVRGSHDKMDSDTLRLFAEVHEGMAIRNFCGTPFVLTHCAMRVWERSHYGAINCYGHSHGRMPEFNDKLQLDVGVDVWQYKPVPVELILMIMACRDFKPEGRVSGEELDARVKELADRNAGHRAHFERKISEPPKENHDTTGNG